MVFASLTLWYFTTSTVHLSMSYRMHTLLSWAIDLKPALPAVLSTSLMTLAQNPFLCVCVCDTLVADAGV